MEGDTTSKIDAVLQTIELLERKSEGYKAAVLAQIDNLHAELSAAQSQLKDSPNAPRAQIFNSLIESIRSKKPLTAIEQKNKDFYKYISKLGKRINTLKTTPDEPLQLYNSNFDQKALKEAIAEFIMYYSIKYGETLGLDIDVVQVCNELGVVYPEALGEKLRQLRSLKDIEASVVQKRLGPVREWVTNNQRELLKINSKLPFLVAKLWVLGRYFQQQTDFTSAVAEIRQQMLHFYDISQRDIDELLSALCVIRFTPKRQTAAYPNNNPDVWTDKVDFQVTNEIEQHYAKLLSGDDWEEIRELLIKESEKILQIPNQNPLFEVFRAGVISYHQFMQFSTLFKPESDKEEPVPFSLELAEEFNHHSLIVCPVSKEVCTPDNPPVVLTCGHVISDASAKKLGQAHADFGATKKFKCPVCPEEQVYSKIKVIKMD